MNKNIRIHSYQRAHGNFNCCGDIILPLQRGVMGFWKFSPFLAVGILVLYQVGTLQAAPFR